MSLQTKSGQNYMNIDTSDVAPSPEQPLNGQGVLRITRSESLNVDDNNKCPSTTVLTAPSKNDCNGSGAEKVNTTSAPLVDDNGVNKDTVLETSGPNASTFEPYNQN